MTEIVEEICLAMDPATLWRWKKAIDKALKSMRDREELWLRR